MTQRRGALVLSVLVLFATSNALLGQSKDDKKKDEAQKKEIASVVKIVDDVAAGTPAANDLQLSWVREDVLKAQGNKQYVPFTVQIDPSKISGPNVAFYWRVVAKSAAPPAPAAGGKKDELSTFMLIYNPKVDSANKPDVSVEYNFYQKPAGAPEKFFNKTNPQALNAQTLPPNFDLAAGHQLQSGQAVPLASFPEGDYRLEIKVTDKIANKTLTREINFTVSPT